MEFVDIDEFDNYEINQIGQVRNKTTGKILQQSISSHGYYVVNMNSDEKRLQRTVHRLLAEAFIPNPDSLPCIDHCDRSRINNNISNLKWVSYSDNNNNKTGSNRNIYEWFSEKPLQCVLFNTYCIHQFNNTWIDLLTFEIYKQFGQQYRKIAVGDNRGQQIYNLTDVGNINRKISINQLRKGNFNK